jgi:hypothetical protein
VSDAQGTGRPGRYVRSTGGLIGSMIVLVLVVVGAVIFRAAFRTTPSYQPERIDYRSLVVSVQQQGLKPVYPAPLPHGWYVKDASFAPGDRPSVDLEMTTDENHFVGMHQEDADVRGLVDDLVGTGTVEGGEVTIPSPVGSTWQEWTDPDGDHAYSMDLHRETLLVYGSAPVAEIKQLIGTLSTAKLKP